MTSHCYNNNKNSTHKLTQLVMLQLVSRQYSSTGRCISIITTMTLYGVKAFFSLSQHS